MNFDYAMLPVSCFQRLMDHITCDEEVPALDVAVILGLCIEESMRRLEKEITEAGEEAKQ